MKKGTLPESVQPKDFVLHARVSFEERTAQVTFRVILVFLLTNGAGSVISSFFSTYTPEFQARNIGLLVPVIAITLVLLVLVHTRLRSPLLRSRVYFSYLIAAYVLAHVINPDKLMVTVNVLTVLIAPVLLMQFHKGYTVFFFCMHLAAAVITFVRFPTATIALGLGYHIYLIPTICAVMYTVMEGIGLFRFYESLLLTHIQKSDQQNEALLALRESEALQAQRITQLAYHDSLTGALNHVGFAEQVDVRIREGAKQACVILLDICDFNVLNATLGYASGDRMLLHVHELLNQAPFHFTHIARLRGDTFGVSLFDFEDVPNLIDYFIGLRMNESGESTDHLLKMNGGVSLFPDHGKTSTELIQNAETALFLSKSKGTDCMAYYDTAIHDEMQKRVMMANTLEGALERGEISLAFQPAVNVDDGEVYGFEALARWYSPRFGQVPPDVFIRIAEQNGIIGRMGQLILEKACGFAKRVNQESLQRLNRVCPVSVNVSGVQLMQPNFADMFVQTLRELETNPAWVAVEVTETAIIQNIEQARTHLESLRRAGISVYLDDFGTGYSSLNYLNMLPVDVLKIDRSFVRQSVVSSKGTRMIQSILDLARNFELLVIAEGVEDQEQADIMLRLGCRLIQGFYYGRPMDEEAALARVSDYTGKS